MTTAIETDQYRACELLDGDDQLYSWAELLGLLEHWRGMDPDGLPAELRVLADGRVVDADWNPGADPDPQVWATREQPTTRAPARMSQDERMTALCRTVPYLADRPGFGLGWEASIVFPGDVPAGDLEYGFPWPWCHSSAAVEAVRFVRHIWNHSHRPPSLAFWDHNHRGVFLAWAADPWWC